MVNLRTAATLLACLALASQPALALEGKIQGLDRHLVGILWHIQHHYGRQVNVTSGCRSYSHNRRIGGARESFHLRCQAADIKVTGVGKDQLARYVRGLSDRGGVGLYCHDASIHVDTGPRREWIWNCHGHRINHGHPAHSRLASG